MNSGLDNCKSGSDVQTQIN